MARRLATAGIPVLRQVLHGEPVSALLTYAHLHPATALIAMATHGRRGLDRWMLASSVAA